MWNAGRAVDWYRLFSDILYCIRSETKDCSQMTAVPLMLKSREILSSTSRMLLSIVSNVAEMSSDRKTVACRSQADNTLFLAHHAHLALMAQDSNIVQIKSDRKIVRPM